MPPVSREKLNKRKPTAIKQYLTNNIKQVSKLQNKSQSEQSLNLQMDENNKNKKQDTQDYITNKYNNKSIQYKK